MITQFGPYLIDEELAQGGMARVFRARLRGLGGFEKTLVLKQIRPELSRDPRFVELFVREANTLVQLVHPHIVPVYELGAVEGTYYLSMEYIEGATLAEILHDGPLGTALVAQIGVQVADALDYAHSRFGILHRDVTPRNLIVDDAGHVRLLDFGIAAALGSESEAFGSPGYMSPEQVEGRPLSIASDLFSLGVVLTEALLGFAPFEKVTRGTLGDRPALTRDPSLPAALSGLLDRMLRKAETERPESAAEVSRSLRAWLAQSHPEGAFVALRTRVRTARERRSKTHEKETMVGAPTTPIGSAEGAAVRTIAASPALTEMLRSASGVSIAPSPQAEGPATRPISRPPSARRARQSNAGANPRVTAWMMRAWPALAFVAMVVLVVMMWARSSPTPARAPTAAPTPDAREPADALPRRVSRDAGAPPTEAESPATKREPATTSAIDSEGRATLTLSALPWAEVSLDGQPLGTTPLRNQRLRAGVHAVVFSCPPLGKTERLSVMVPRDARGRIVIDFSTEPARRSLDGVSEAR